MIRKAIIVVLTLGAVGIAALAPASMIMSPGWSGVIKEGDKKDGGECWLLVRVVDGRLAILSEHDFAATPTPGPFFNPIRNVTSFSVVGLRVHIETSTRVAAHMSDSVDIRWFPKKHLSTEWYIPLWIPFILFSAYPTIAFIRGPLRRWRRRKRGLCIRCGYNLEGNVSGTCPECGMATQV